ncbi:MAG: hypothetical protein MJZ64_00290 [Paludibacteraceae bacterium]|nr:hypothetical protein [Paludibacteraceae bacterium]
MHHWIALRLEPLMEDEFIDDSYNCRKGKGTDYGIERIVEMIDTISCHYAKSIYVGKYDMRGYFMSIDKDILWDMIKSLIDRRYCGDDKQTLLYLTKETIYNIPQENCIRTCPLEEWDDIPKSKTLFSHPANKGLPIGNLTSQLFANYYFSDIDREMKERHEGYSRYVDDGTIIAVTVDEICDGFVYVRERSRQKGCEIHPNKFYIQPVAHGFKIIGRVIKPYRIYVSNRIRNKMRSKVIGFGKIRNVTRDVEFHLVQSMNSYLGLMNRLAAYNVKKENLEMIDPRYFEYIEIEGNYELLKMKKNGSKKNL